MIEFRSRILVFVFCLTHLSVFPLFPLFCILLGELNILMYHFNISSVDFLNIPIFVIFSDLSRDYPMNHLL